MARGKLGLGTTDDNGNALRLGDKAIVRVDFSGGARTTDVYSGVSSGGSIIDTIFPDANNIVQSKVRKYRWNGTAWTAERPDDQRVTRKAGDPVADEGSDGDWHINTVSRKALEKVAGTWTEQYSVAPANATGEYVSTPQALSAFAVGITYDCTAWGFSTTPDWASADILQDSGSAGRPYYAVYDKANSTSTSLVFIIGGAISGAGYTAVIRAIETLS